MVGAAFLKYWLGHPLFCRNVVIYFDADTQASLWPRFRQRLGDGGWIFLGHSERISDSAMTLFDPNGMTAYRAAASATR